MENVAHENVKTICVMIGDISYDYALELMNGINDAAKRNGVQLFYMTGKQKHTAPVDPHKERTTVSRYNSIYNYSSLVGADAYIISSGSLSGFENETEYQQFLKRFEGSAYVLLQKDFGLEGPRTSSITIDNYRSYCQCIEHLIRDHGYKKIAFVSGPKQHPEASERERAFRDTMKRYGLSPDEDMIAYGDLSGFVDEQVIELLSEHADLEAIAFCNDEMAKAGYRVCEQSGLRVGKDIAITGFDDFSTGRSLTPPLTTISQNAYRTGELALMQAISLAEGRPVESVRLETSMQIRNSCGCSHFRNSTVFHGDVDDTGYLGSVIRDIRSNLMQICIQDGREYRNSPQEKLMGRIASLVQEPAEPLDELALEAWLTGFAGELKDTAALVAERFHVCLLKMADDSDHPYIIKLRRIILFIQGFLFSYAMREAAGRFERFRSQAWFVPEFIRDLVVLEDEDESVFQNVVEQMRSIGLDNMYICLLPEPQSLSEQSRSIIPDRLLLAAYFCGSISGAYPRSQMPIIDQGHPLNALPNLMSSSSLISFSIFSGDTQYGILLCDANKEKIPLLHVIGLQLGILINFLDMEGKERIVQRELEHIRERIEVLNFLSDYDSLCNVYNRRGFITRAIHTNQENIGKSAYIAFLDLDHLKEINDKFGHTAGDDAICVVSNILNKIVRSNDLIARIGGDEFVSMFITDKQDFQATFKARLKDAFEEYNRISGKPYFVEASLGITYFTCKQGLEIGRIIDEADHFLYEEKQNKRASALK